MIPSFLKSLVPKSLSHAYTLELRKETHINRALRRLSDDSFYVEIGVREGNCIRQIKAARKYAVDPAPLALGTTNWRGVTIFEVTSDEFFENHARDAIGHDRVHVALVDGLHEFPQALRDVLNLEPYMHPRGAVFIHDCNPPSRDNVENRTGGAWNGDVWKVPYYLQQFRPDLSCVTLDCDWGLGVVSGFSPHPPEPDPGHIARVAALDYEFLEKNRRSVLNLRSPLFHRAYGFRRYNAWNWAVRQSSEARYGV